MIGMVGVVCVVAGFVRRILPMLLSLLPLGLLLWTYSDAIAFGLSAPDVLAAPVFWLAVISIKFRLLLGCVLLGLAGGLPVWIAYLMATDPNEVK